MFQLHEMRHHPVLKWTMYVVFALVIISFVFFYGWHPDEKGRSTAYAKLKKDNLFGGWHDITGAQMQQAQSRAIAEKRALLPPQMARNLPPSVAERLVTPGEVAQEAANQILIDRQASKLGVTYTRADIIELLRKQPGITNEMIINEARQQNMDVESFLEYLRRSQEINVVRQLEQMPAQASLYELWQEYTLAKEKIKIQVAAYPVATFAAQVSVTEADLETYLKDHKAQFAIPDQRRYAYAKLTLSDLREKVQITSAALQTFYEQNQAKFLEKAAIRTDELVAPLAKDRSTTDVVNALLAVRETAAQTQDWALLNDKLKQANPKLSFYHRKSPWLTKDDTQNRSELFLQRAAALSNDQVSTPVVDTDNVYLIRVLERRKEGTPPLATIREKVETEYRDAEARKQFEAAEKHWNDVIAQQKSVATFAQAIGVKDELTTRVNRTDAYIPGFASLYRDRAYLESLTIHELSSLVKTDDLIGVLEVVEEIPAHDPPLSEVRAKVEKAYRDSKAVALAENAAKQSYNLLKSGAPFEQALANAPKKPYTTEPFTRTDTVSGLDAPLLDFTTQTLSLRVSSAGISAYGSNRTEPLGFAVYKVAELTPPTKDQFAKDRQQFAADYLQVQRNTIIREWLADMRKRADFQLVNK